MNSNSETSIYCLVLQTLVPGKGMAIYALAFPCGTSEEAGAWVAGYISGANIPFDRETSNLDIFRYEGGGTIADAQRDVERMIEDQAEEQGITYREPTPGEISEAINEILIDEGFWGSGALVQKHPLNEDDEAGSFDGGVLEGALFDALKGLFDGAGVPSVNPHAVPDDGEVWYSMGECSMCGKPAGGTDENGMCSSCRQIWNS